MAQFAVFVLSRENYKRYLGTFDELSKAVGVAYLSAIKTVEEINGISKVNLMKRPSGEIHSPYIKDLEHSDQMDDEYQIACLRVYEDKTDKAPYESYLIFYKDNR